MRKADYLLYTFVFVLSLFVSLLAHINFVSAYFSTAVTLGQNVIYQGDTLEVAGILRNTASKMLLINFPGPCQATFVIWNQQGRVYPQNKAQFPCNNHGYERFVMGPNQFHTYRFKHDTSFLKPGDYQLAVLIDGFAVPQYRNFKIIKRPETFVKHGEFCEGLTLKQCDKGLVCKHLGEFYLGAGICLYNNQSLPFLDLY